MTPSEEHTRPGTPLSNILRRKMETDLLRSFLMSALAQGHAVSDRVGAVTWSNPTDVTPGSMPMDRLIAVTHGSGFGVKLIEAPEDIDVVVLYPDVDIRIAVDMILARNVGSLDDIVVHENCQLNSPGISWQWIRRETMLPSCVCLQHSITKYIQRQNMRVAEAADAQSREAEEDLRQDNPKE